MTLTAAPTVSPTRLTAAPTVAPTRREDPVVDAKGGVIGGIWDVVVFGAVAGVGCIILTLCVHRMGDAWTARKNALAVIPAAAAEHDDVEASSGIDTMCESNPTGNSQHRVVPVESRNASRVGSRLPTKNAQAGKRGNQNRVKAITDTEKAHASVKVCSEAPPPNGDSVRSRMNGPSQLAPAEYCCDFDTEEYHRLFNANWATELQSPDSMSELGDDDMV